MVPAQASRLLRLRYAAKCARCGASLRPGDRARYYPFPKLVTCPDCVLVGVAAPGQSGPGASARREYERLHQRREDAARERLGGPGVLLARAVGEPQSTTAWKQGADGEVRVGHRLEKLLAGSGVPVLHDRRRPGGKANIDHIAVGPGGVTERDDRVLCMGFRRRHYRIRRDADAHVRERRQLPGQAHGHRR